MNQTQDFESNPIDMTAGSPVQNKHKKLLLESESKRLIRKMFEKKNHQLLCCCVSMNNEMLYLFMTLYDIISSGMIMATVCVLSPFDFAVSVGFLSVIICWQVYVIGTSCYYLRARVRAKRLKRRRGTRSHSRSSRKQSQRKKKQSRQRVGSHNVNVKPYEPNKSGLGNGDEPVVMDETELELIERKQTDGAQNKVTFKKTDTEKTKVKEEWKNPLFLMPLQTYYYTRYLISVADCVGNISLFLEGARYFIYNERSGTTIAMLNLLSVIFFPFKLCSLYWSFLMVMEVQKNNKKEKRDVFLRHKPMHQDGYLEEHDSDDE